MMMMVTEGLCVDKKAELCVKGWSGANNPSVTMSPDSMIPLVKRICFQIYIF